MNTYLDSLPANPPHGLTPAERRMAREQGICPLDADGLEGEQETDPVLAALVARANASGQMPADISRQAVYHDTAWRQAPLPGGYHFTPPETVRASVPSTLAR